MPTMAMTSARKRELRKRDSLQAKHLLSHAQVRTDLHQGSLLELDFAPCLGLGPLASAPALHHNDTKTLTSSKSSPADVSITSSNADAMTAAASNSSVPSWNTGPKVWPGSNKRSNSLSLCGQTLPVETKRLEEDLPSLSATPPVPLPAAKPLVGPGLHDLIICAHNRSISDSLHPSCLIIRDLEKQCSNIFCMFRQVSAPSVRSLHNSSGSGKQGGSVRTFWAVPFGARSQGGWRLELRQPLGQAISVDARLRGGPTTAATYYDAGSRRRALMAK